jgi:hypothetical protein
MSAFTDEALYSKGSGMNYELWDVKFPDKTPEESAQIYLDSLIKQMSEYIKPALTKMFEERRQFAMEYTFGPIEEGK